MHAFFQNMDGGSSDLNISYGSTAPSDTSKLWVNCAEPEKVLMDNSMGVQFGDMSLFDTIDLGTTSTRNFKYYNNKLYYIGTGDYLCAYDLDTKVVSNITRQSGTIISDCSNNKFAYVWVPNSTNSQINIIDLDNGVVTRRMIFSSVNNANPGCSYVMGDYIYIPYQSGSTDQDSMYVLKISTLSNSRYSLIGDGRRFPRLTIGDGSRFVYCFVGGLSGGFYINKYDTSTGSNTMALNIGGEGYGSIFSTYTNNLIILGPYNTATSILAYNTISNTISQIGTTPFTSGFTNCPIALSDDGFLYYSDRTRSHIYRYKINQVLQNNYLAINFNTQNSRWQVLEDEDELSIKVNPVSVYRGNSSNQGIKQNAYLHINGSWQAI